jgi:transaldolase / glucose-6-phosphate isomerase
MIGATFDHGELSDSILARQAGWETSGVVTDVAMGRVNLWGDAGTPELANRVGWITLPLRYEDVNADVVAARTWAAEQAFDEIVVLGMGGSSLAPEVMGLSLQSKRTLRVIDTTHPDAVDRLMPADPIRTGFIVSSKSGGTLETMSLFGHAWELVAAVTETPGSHFVAVTDPGSSLATLAVERGFAHVALADPNVGGRFSALTAFGLVPAAAAGVDTAALVSAAERVVLHPDPHHPGVILGAQWGEAAVRGRDKLTIVTSESLRSLPSWIEQLVAESTGKDDTGIVPVPANPSEDQDSWGRDRVVVFLDTETDPLAVTSSSAPSTHLRLTSVTDLGAAMYVLEVATAFAGAVLGIHPFNQPDVQLAKDLAKQALAGELATPDRATLNSDDPAVGANLSTFLADHSDGDYAVVLAYLDADAATTEHLEALTGRVRTLTGLPTVLQIGPRYLHSTGQLHKGGPNSGLFIEIIGEPRIDLPIPGQVFTFGELVAAQALADYAALDQRGRRVVRLRLGADVPRSLHQVTAALRS